MPITKLTHHTDISTSQPACASLKNNQSNTSSFSFKQRVIRRCVAALIFMIVFCLINVALMCAFVPYSSWSLISWEAFNKASHVDTIITGSSYAERTINPTILDDKLHTTTYTVAVPLQSLHDSFHAIKKTHETRGISRVILGLRHESLWDDPNETDLKRHAIFSTGYLSDLSLPYYLKDVSQTVFDPHYFGKRDSLNYPVLWGYHVNRKSDPLNNLSQRLSSTDRIADSVIHYHTWHYYANGYGNYSSNTKWFDHGVDLNKRTLTPFEFGKLSDEHMKTYEEICKYCKEHNIELITVIAPYPSFVFVNDKGVYPSMMKPLEALAQKYGSRYIDLNLVKDNQYRPSLLQFYDVEHLNSSGADRVSALVADILSNTDPDARMNELLYRYDQWEDCRNSYPGVQHVSCTISAQDGEQNIHIDSCHNDKITPEFRIVARKVKENLSNYDIMYRAYKNYDPTATEVIRDWSSETDFTWKPKTKGKYILYIQSRPLIQSDQDCGLTRVITVV